MSEQGQSKWDGQCSRPDCSRTKPPIAYGNRYGECYVHEILGVYFQYEMYGEEDGWTEFEEFDNQYELWLKKLTEDGVNLDEFAEAFGKS